MNHSDAAKRCSDQITLHLIADFERAKESWVAIRLSDGGSDGKLYDTRQDAIRFQLHETQCCYIKIPWSGMTAQDAEIFLRCNRELYDNGARMTDPIHINPNLRRN